MDEKNMYLHQPEEEDEEDVVLNVMGILKAMQEKSAKDDFSNTVLQRKIENGKEALFTKPLENKENDIDAISSEIKINALESFSAPAVTLTNFDPELIEQVAVMALQGMSVWAMVKQLNNTVFAAKKEFTPYIVRSILLDNECKRVMLDIKTNLLERAKDHIHMNAQKAVDKLLAGLDSKNEKISLACAKELIRLSGIGETQVQQNDIKGKAQNAANEQLLFLAKTLIGEAK